MTSFLTLFLKVKIKELKKNKMNSSVKNIRCDIKIIEIKAKIIKLRDNNKENKQLI